MRRALTRKVTSTARIPTRAPQPTAIPITAPLESVELAAESMLDENVEIKFNVTSNHLMGYLVDLVSLKAQRWLY
jgi:hypothetical protein